MIEITPAILTNELSDFQATLRKFEHFNSIDIDVCLPPFTEHATLQIDDIIAYLDLSKTTSLGFHLMVAQPESEVAKIKKLFGKRELRVYLHQEANIKFLSTYSWPKNWRRGIALRTGSKLKELSFYESFDEVQLMTIEIGEQGNVFVPEVLEKCVNLRAAGYTKLISVDGGVNLKTAPVISNYELDRVSVGSYFVNSDDLELAKMKLELALNMKSSRNGVEE